MEFRLKPPRAKTFAVLTGLLIITVTIYVLLGGPTDDNNAPSVASPVGLTLVSKTPDNDNIESPWSVEPVSLRFNYKINPNTIIYNITPAVNSKIQFENTSPYSITIVPIEGWRENVTYTITISELNGNDNEKLIDPITFTLKRVFNPKNFPPPVDE